MTGKSGRWKRHAKLALTLAVPLAATLAALTQSERPTTADRLPAALLAESAEAPAAEAADAPTATCATGSAASDACEAPATRPGTEAALRGKLDLARARLEGDRYRVRLKDGRTAVLTLDPKLQQAATRALHAEALPYAAAVVLASDGRVLALAGQSTAEPALTVTDLTTRPWAPAASVFKLVTASALIDHGVGSEARVCYHGGLHGIDEQNLADDPRRDRECNTLAFGIGKSQNCILGKLAARNLTPSDVARYADAFGWNRAIDFALPVTVSRAHVPDGDLAFARVAAGFWETELSPLHGALLAETFANGGVWVPPRLIAEIDGPGGEVTVPAAPAPHRVVSAATAAAVGRMMIGTTTFGTARASFVGPHGEAFLPVSVAGKTGSLSRVVGADAAGVPNLIHYNWFVGFAPADSPRYAVAVLVGADPGSRVRAHAIAERLLTEALGAGTPVPDRPLRAVRSRRSHAARTRHARHSRR